MAGLEPRKTKSNKNTLLRWIAIISFLISVTVYILLGEQAQADVAIEKQRLLFIMIGILISGISLLCAYSEFWYKTK